MRRFHSNGLGAVHAGSAAQTDDHLSAMRFCHLRACRDILCGGIWLYAVKMGHFQSGHGQYFFHPLIHRCEYGDCRRGNKETALTETEGNIADLFNSSCAENYFRRLKIRK